MFVTTQSYNNLPQYFMFFLISLHIDSAVLTNTHHRKSYIFPNLYAKNLFHIQDKAKLQSFLLRYNREI